MALLRDITAQRTEHLRMHTGEESAQSVVRSIAAKLELRPDQERRALIALRKALHMDGLVTIDICLQVEHARGLAHGLIYREIADCERNRLPQLERQFGPLPLTVEEYENGFKPVFEEAESGQPCTLVDDLRLDFTQRLMRSVLSRAIETPVMSAKRELPPTPSKKAEKNGTHVEKKAGRVPPSLAAPASVPHFEPGVRTLQAFKTESEKVSVAGMNVIRRNGRLYAVHTVPTQEILPLLIPDETNTVADSVQIAIPSIAAPVILKSEGKKIVASGGGVLERNGTGWTLLQPVDTASLLAALIPEDVFVES